MNVSFVYLILTLFGSVATDTTTYVSVDCPLEATITHDSESGVLAVLVSGIEGNDVVINTGPTFWSSPTINIELKANPANVTWEGSAS